MKYKLVLLVLFVTLFSCEKLRYGNILEKNYHPYYVTHTILMMPISTGKSTVLIPIPYTIYHNESWEICVKGIGEKGDTITRTFYINKSKFDSLNIGDFICVDGYCSDDTATHKIRE